MKHYSYPFFVLKIMVFIGLFCYSSLAQDLFIQHTIDNNFLGACSVCSYDIDSDGDLDILAAGNSGNQIAWWKAEMDTSLLFSKFVVDQGATGIIFVDAADVDNDNHIDILGASWQGNEIAVWKNLGGDPIVWEKTFVDDNIVQAHEVRPAYVDSDSLIDLIATSGGNHQIVWYRNGGGNPIIWEKNIVDNQFTGARSVASYDMDGDGNNDLIGAALNASQLSIWYNNGSNPIQWSKQVVDNSFGGAHWVHICDLDKDNNPDILGAAFSISQIAWWKNLGGSPVQFEKQIIGSGFGGALSVAAADLDLDNDVDVFGAATNANKVSWWENNGGNPIQWFTNSVLTNYGGAWPVFAVDLDEDGDTDILTTASTGNKITWLENTTVIVGTQNESSGLPKNFFLFQNYPNPFNPSTTFKYKIPSVSFVSLKIFDVLGNEIMTLVNEERPAGSYEVEFSASSLTSGIYLYQLRAGEFISTKKMIMLK